MSSTCISTNSGAHTSGKRKRCVICLREIANDADWEANGNLSSENEDVQAEALGLNGLCWDQEDDSCMATALELGRPTNYLEAMEVLEQERGSSASG